MLKLFTQQVWLLPSLIVVLSVPPTAPVHHLQPGAAAMASSRCKQMHGQYRPMRGRHCCPG